MSKLNLENKVVIITGASSGIGKALALDALNQNAKVVVCARNLESLQNQFANFSTDKILCVACDVSKEIDCENLINKSIQHFGSIDILINNAGISMRALFENADLKVIKQLMDINFWGTVYCTKYALPYILKTKGQIASISSIAGYRGLPGRTGYSASKFAMQGFMEALRTELLYKNVNVLWISPGFTSSNIRNTALNDEGKSQSETPLDEKKLMSAEECSSHIWKAIEKRKRTLVLSSQGKLTVWINKLFPSFADKLIFKHFAKEPNSPLKY